MDSRLLDQIRFDLDLVFPHGGYTLTAQSGDPPLRLSWDVDVHVNMQRFSEEIVRLHNVRFESARAPARTKRHKKRKNPDD